MISDADLRAAIDVVGAHYPCGGDGSSAFSCASTANAVSLGKPLWASENGSQDYNTGAPAMARAINRGYTDAKMTAYINWPIVAALPPSLPFETTGLIVARQPWSGAYSLGKSVWVTAHTTQFAQPGWTYIDGASGYIGGGEPNGTYVTLRSPNGTDYSTIYETSTATAPQMVTVRVSGLSMGTVHVWATNLVTIDAASDFNQLPDVTPSGGVYSLTLQPGYVYSVTTTNGQGKGTAASPAPASFGLPYGDDFEGSTVGTQPRFLADQDGAFEVVACGGGRTGRCARQMAPKAPIVWHPNNGTPYSTIGDSGWANYTVSADVLLEQPGSVELVGRYGGRNYWAIGSIHAYYLRIADTGAWAILKNSDADNSTIATLASGTVTALGTKTWHTVTFTLSGGALSGTIDGAAVGPVTDTAYLAGPAGLAVGVNDGAPPAQGWLNAQFDNLSVTPVGKPSVPFTYFIANRASGDVLEVAGQATTSGAAIDQFPNHGGTNQQWQLVGGASGFLTLVNVGSGLALDVPGGSTAADTQLDQGTRSGTASQEWHLTAAGGGYYALVSQDGLFADVRGGSTAHGAAVVQALASGGASQQWSLSPVPVAGGTYEIVNGVTGYLIDVVAESGANGALIDQWPDHDGANQQWTLEAAGAGIFNLVNVKSNAALDVPGFSTAAGTQLDQWALNNGTNQQFRLLPTAGGLYSLVNVWSGLAVDIASPAQGAAVVQNAPADAGAPSQGWRFSAVW
jgi:hypothetical protein